MRVLLESSDISFVEFVAHLVCYQHAVLNFQEMIPYNFHNQGCWFMNTDMHTYPLNVSVFMILALARFIFRSFVAFCSK